MPVTLHCLADVCLIPIGTNSASGSDEIAAVTQLARSSHLKCTLHSAGTTIDGPWNEVMELIGQMHELLHKRGIVRLHSDIRVGTRTDKSQSAASKMQAVEEKIKRLGKDKDPSS
ncbi:UPF0045 protein Ecm15p [[Candida] railenensis]|uniref:UPF0045 protein Ecm15p n=1 Tax=[Candida] railenensis TaxID=45579 RepID=A0A9P0VWA3_9ASCO|nr:UPF0045 protein Ecm15p [[Candida] railenensis]